MTDPDALELLDVKAVAKLFKCSARTVFRMADEGAMPTPVKLGALVRWPRATLTKWVAAGCPRAGSPGAGDSGG